MGGLLGGGGGGGGGPKGMLAPPLKLLGGPGPPLAPPLPTPMLLLLKGYPFTVRMMDRLCTGLLFDIKFITMIT